MGHCLNHYLPYFKREYCGEDFITFSVVDNLASIDHNFYKYVKQILLASWKLAWLCFFYSENEIAEL